MAMTKGRERAGVGPAKLDAQGALNGMTPLHDAIWHGHLDAARVLVSLVTRWIYGPTRGGRPASWPSATAMTISPSFSPAPSKRDHHAHQLR